MSENKEGKECLNNYGFIPFAVLEKKGFVQLYNYLFVIHKNL